MRVLIFAALLVGCATVPKPVEPLISVDRRPEGKSLPPNPREEKLDLPGPETVTAVEKGSVVTTPGLLATEARVARDILFRTRYDELRRVFEADRSVWSVQRALYEEQLQRLAEQNAKLQPTWWDQHKEVFYFVAGTLIGFGVTYGITEIVFSTKGTSP